MMQEIDARFDHSFVMYVHDDFAEIFGQIADDYDQKIEFVTFVPTAENLAKHWYKLIKAPLESRNIKIKHVKVWETPTSTAIYEESSSN